MTSTEGTHPLCAGERSSRTRAFVPLRSRRIWASPGASSISSGFTPIPSSPILTARPDADLAGEEGDEDGRKVLGDQDRSADPCGQRPEQGGDGMEAPRGRADREAAELRLPARGRDRDRPAAKASQALGEDLREAPAEGFRARL
jgi:hypothetical protein